jgi:ribosomal protein S21
MTNVRVESYPGQYFKHLLGKFNRAVKEAGVLSEAKRRKEFERACDKRRGKRERKWKLSRGEK